MEFVIIGGDAAGMSAASRARRLMPGLNITVFEKTRDVSYSACGMPYNIADPDRMMDDLVVRKAGVFRDKQNIDLKMGYCVESILPDEKRVRVSVPGGGEIEKAYDKLLIATGSSAIVPDLPGFGLDGVMALKSLEDGRRIKLLLSKPVRKAVIIGMGYIALEMCEALRARDIEVDMVKPRPVFLPAMEPALAGAVLEEVKSNRVGVYCGHEIRHIEKTDGRLKVVCTDMELEGDMVLVAAGVAPNSGIASDAGLKTGIADAVSVDMNLLTTNKHIYAAGDCADAVHVVTGEKTWIPLALRANRAGWAVADNVCGKDVKLPGIVGTAVFKVFEQQVARTGLNAKEAALAGFDPVDVSIESSSRAHLHPGSTDILVQMTGDKKSGRLLGAQMTGRESVAHRINAAAVALHGHMTVDQFLQCDLAYAPPFGPVWDPLLTAASQLLKKM